MTDRRVGDYMCTFLATVTEEKTLGVVAEAFEQYPFHHLPVLGREGNDVIGVVSDRDLLRECLAGRYDPGRPVTEIMSRELLTIRHDAPLADAVQQLLDAKVNCLLVEDEQGRLRGMLTSRDVLRAYSRPAR